MPLQMSRARSASYYKEASRESPSCKVNKTALGQSTKATRSGDNPEWRPHESHGGSRPLGLPAVGGGADHIWAPSRPAG